MSLAGIIRLRLDQPALTSQQLADQALVADQEARRLAKAGDARADDARRDADQLADQCALRALSI